MQHKSWLDRVLDPLAQKLDEIVAMMCTRDFWAVVAVAATVAGFVITAFIMLTNFNIMRMRNCFNSSNISAYLMVNTVMFFVFGGMMAIGEVFNYFDNKKRGIPHKRISLFWFIIATTALGSGGLLLLKFTCFSSIY